MLPDDLFEKKKKKTKRNKMKEDKSTFRRMETELGKGRSGRSYRVPSHSPPTSLSPAFCNLFMKAFLSYGSVEARVRAAKVLLLDWTGSLEIMLVTRSQLGGK